MDAASLALVLGGLATLSTAVLAGVAGLSSARSKRNAEDVEVLTARVDELDDDVVKLSSWQVAARRYIFKLLSMMADRGIEAPEPPTELELTVESTKR